MNVPINIHPLIHSYIYIYLYIPQYSGIKLDPAVQKLASALQSLKAEEASQMAAVNKPKGLFEMIDMNTGGVNPMSGKE
jgi:hypothetical protein